MSELSVIERILINIINRKQKTLYNMTLCPLHGRRPITGTYYIIRIYYDYMT